MQPPPPPDSEFYAPCIQLHPAGEPLQLSPNAPRPQAVQYWEVYKNDWNKNEEILETLLAVEADPNSRCITGQVPVRPPCSGSRFLYRRMDGSWFKNDGYIWQNRRGGRNTREDHAKLKVKGEQKIEARYIHSAIVPTFHRRTYFLPGGSHVLVHYLNKQNESMTFEETAEEIARSLKANNAMVSVQQLVEQLSCIYSAVHNTIESVHHLAHAVTEHLRRKGFVLPDSPVPQGSVTPTARELHLERRNSCSSAFRKGLSSVALRRQPSANSEIDANHIGTMLKRFGCNGSSTDKIPVYPPAAGNFYPQEPRQVHPGMESRSPSGDADSRPMNYEQDSPYQQPSVRSSTNGSTPASAFAEKVKITNASLESPMGPPATPSTSSAISTSLTPIVEMSPNSSPLKGGQKVLLVGKWYMKGHDYKISFGRGRMMTASLIAPGVLSCIVPPSLKPEVVQVRVFCNGQPVSTTADFTYEPPAEQEQKETDDKLVQIFEKIRIMACAFNAYSVVENIPSSSCMESLLTSLVQQIDNEVSTRCSGFQSELLNGSAQFPSKTVLHLVALFDYDRLFEALIDLSRKVPSCRELDIFARDNDGSTPLHYACRHSSSRTARLIMSFFPTTIDVLDDRGKTPPEVAPDNAIGMLSDKNNEEERVNATELWVMTNGKTFTSDNLLSEKISRTPIAEQDDVMREATSSYSVMSELYEVPAMLLPSTSRECDEDCDSCCEASEQGPLHVAISMDTDVHVPDSPKMARLFRAVTSPGIAVTPNARARMADLARQIIDALPDRIKRNSEVSTFPDEEDFSYLRGMDSMGYQASSSMSVDSPSNMTDEFIEMMTADTAARNEFAGPRSTETTETNRCAQLFATNCNFFDDRSFASSSTRANTFESDTLDFDKDLGEFFTIHVDSCIDPIQQRLANLKYNDDEQRDVYEAAMVIQRAYREYRARSTTRRQEDIERRAALKIQGCYRRYKQFCYFKKLHNAAIVVQKHFRMKKRDDKEGAVESVIASVPEHPTLDGQSICIQVPKTNFDLRERAATTIQVAYRYRHRKRQAAARKIQNFMRQSRNKLRKMHAQNEDGTSPARKPVESNATSEMLAANGKEMHSTMPQTSFQAGHSQQLIIDQHSIINGTN